MIARYARQLWKASGAFDGASRLQRAAATCDMMWCAIRYGASPNNYVAFGFRDLPGAARSSFISYRDNRRLMSRLNSARAREIFEDKVRFADAFGSHLGRRVLDLSTASDQELRAYIRPGSGYVVKPRCEGQGRGVRVLEDGTVDDLLADREARANLCAEGGVMEELLGQHEKISRAFGRGMAPVRVVTILANERVTVAFAAVTLGGANPVVNLHLGGLMAPVDDTNGIIKGPAVDKDGRVFHLHPETSQVFKGFALPMWPEVLELIERVSRLIPDAGYVGWDVGISSSGPVVIEGNTDPGTYVSLQRPVYTGLRQGLRDRIHDHL